MITASYVQTDGRGNESGMSDSDSGDDDDVTSSSHLFPSPPIQAAAVAFVCLCECVNTIDMKLQPSVGR